MTRIYGDKPTNNNNPEYNYTNTVWIWRAKTAQNLKPKNKVYLTIP